jgi:uncharacterized protein YeaO (DUF488 family)
MAVGQYQIGAKRRKGEGTRLGTVRRPPRGVKKSDWAKKDYFDQWLPEIAPSQPLVSFYYAEPMNDRRWAAYTKRFAAEMRKPPAQRMLDLLAGLSREASFSVGCYCDHPVRCHRWLLLDMLKKKGGRIRK